MVVIFCCPGIFGGFGDAADGGYGRHAALERFLSGKDRGRRLSGKGSCLSSKFGRQLSIE